MRNNPGKRLTILSDAERVALYGLPDFDDFQRVEFFAMTDAERTMALQRRGLEEQIYCLLQIGYFKAKQAFFHFPLEGAPPSDIAFLLQRYFPGKELAPNAKSLSKRQYYAQRDDISKLFGYRLCSDADTASIT